MNFVCTASLAVRTLSARDATRERTQAGFMSPPPYLSELAVHLRTTSMSNDRWCGVSPSSSLRSSGVWCVSPVMEDTRTLRRANSRCLAPSNSSGVGAS
jgi:hypothetical protein